MKKLKTAITEADLLQARKEGLERARSLDAHDHDTESVIGGDGLQGIR